MYLIYLFLFYMVCALQKYRLAKKTASIYHNNNRACSINSIPNIYYQFFANNRILIEFYGILLGSNAWDNSVLFKPIYKGCAFFTPDFHQYMDSSSWLFVLDKLY